LQEVTRNCALDRDAFGPDQDWREKPVVRFRIALSVSDKIN